MADMSTARPVPLVLDMLSGTGAYNKTMTVTQAIEAYAAIQTHQVVKLNVALCACLCVPVHVLVPHDNSGVGARSTSTSF
jgi:hypothetical protein